MQLTDSIRKDIEFSKKYTTQKDLIKGDYSLYCRIRNYGKVSELCPHLIPQLKMWDKDSCFQVAKEYKTRTALKKGNGAVYQWLRRNKLVDEACAHMELKRVPKWTKDSAFLRASKYTNSVKFRNENGGCEAWLRHNNLYHEATSHFIQRDTTRKFKEIKGKSGVYFLYNKSEIVYIGKSETNLARRIERHKTLKDKEFDTIKAYIITNMADIQLAELYLIHKYTPKYNKDSNSGDIPTLLISNLHTIMTEYYHYEYDGESFVS